MLNVRQKRKINSIFVVQLGGNVFSYIRVSLNFTDQKIMLKWCPNAVDNIAQRQPTGCTRFQYLVWFCVKQFLQLSEINFSLCTVRKIRINISRQNFQITKITNKDEANGTYSASQTKSGPNLQKVF